MDAAIARSTLAALNDCVVRQFEARLATAQLATRLFGVCLLQCVIAMGLGMLFQTIPAVVGATFALIGLGIAMVLLSRPMTGPDWLPSDRWAELVTNQPEAFTAQVIDDLSTASVRYAKEIAGLAQPMEWAFRLSCAALPCGLVLDLVLWCFL